MYLVFIYFACDGNKILSKGLNILNTDKNISPVLLLPAAASVHCERCINPAVRFQRARCIFLSFCIQCVSGMGNEWCFDKSTGVEVSAR